jgi:hypothetical protein
MLSRRAFLGGLSASLPILLLPQVSRAQSGVQPRLHAMIVGINRYTGRDARGPIRSLRGCINDATDIVRSVRPLQPVSFRWLGWNEPAQAEMPVTRTDFLGTWRDMIAAGQPGDTLLVTYSGHGSQVPVLPGNPSHEKDGYDETLVLTGYNVSDGRNGECIIDDEINDLVLAAKEKGVIVVFVSDSCHSGTVFRAVDLRADVTYRTINPDPGARGSPTLSTTLSSEPEPPIPSNLLFLAGAQDDELVPELSINGVYHGALSVAVAQAIAGGAAADGIITAYGLARFVLHQVRNLSDGGQHAGVNYNPAQVAAPSSGKATPALARGVRRDTPLFVLGRATPKPTGVTPAGGGIEPVRLRILGRNPDEQQSIVQGLQNAVLAGQGQAPTLVWDAGRGLILNDQGNQIAEDVAADGLQHAVDRRLALDRLTALAANGLDVNILLEGRQTPASDATHKPRTHLEIAIAGVQDGHYYSCFNLTGNGKVEMLEPYPGDPPRFARPSFRTGTQKNGRGVPQSPGTGADISLGGVFVKPEGPFGAEHVVVVAGALPLEELMPALQRAHNDFAVPGAMAGLARELERQPLKVGFRGIYTGRG